MADALNIHGLPVRFESVSAVTASPSVSPGARTIDAGNEYLYVYNGGNTQVSVGQGVFISPSDYNSGFTGAVSNAASQSGGERLMGVVHHATLTTGTYGWVVTKGLSYIALDASQVSMNAGAILVPGVDGGFVAYAGTGATGIPCGVALNSLVTTVGTGKGRIKSPIFG
jgi:hypothetical protein